METVSDFAELDRGGPMLDRLGRGWARRIVHSRLARIVDGRLTLREPDGTVHGFGAPSKDGLEARIDVLDARFYARLVSSGSLGGGEAFMAGEWRSEDPVAVIRVLARNRDAVSGLDGGVARFALPFLRFFHRGRRNSKQGSQRNIEAHYDLGNEFFSLFLDGETMFYSSALFERSEMTLESAQVAKCRRIADLLALEPRDHLLEIGTGWGAMAVHAASTAGCRVTTTTISPRQRDFARGRVADAGLSGRVEVIDRDYRDLEGRYDKLVSIEMVEAVGAAYLDGFFRTCADRLRAGGRMVMQSITIAEPLFEEASRSVDFIQRYIFPGGFIPSVSSLVQAAGRAGLVTVGIDDLGASYAETLRHWRQRFEAAKSEIEALGFSERFQRMWRYYFAYCEAGFRERTISDVHLVFEKPSWAR